MGGGGGGISGIDFRVELDGVVRWPWTSGGGSGGSNDKRGWRGSDSFDLLGDLDSDLDSDSDFVLDSLMGSGMAGISAFLEDALTVSSFSEWVDDDWTLISGGGVRAAEDEVVVFESA